ncbi:MAG: YceI family protein [Pseudomonadota bacterium]
MALSNTQDTYGGIAKIFHWLTALLILTAVPVVIVAENLAVAPETLALKAQLFSIHKTLGVMAFFVALFRILWALGQKKPGLLNAEKEFEAFCAETAHWLLYASLVVVPLSGWIHHAATSGFAPILWPLGQSLPLVPKSELVAEIFAITHKVFAYLMGLTLAAHIGGALKHHVIDKDATLRRMWFGPVHLPKLAPHMATRSPIFAASAIYLAAVGLASALALSAPPHEEDIVAEAVVAEAAAPVEDQAPGTWQVESGTISIEVQQFGSAVTGTFGAWTAEITYDKAAEGPIKGRVEAEIDIASLTLGSVTDNALGPEFFDAVNFPTATYGGDIVEGENGLLVDGTLALKGAEIAVPLAFTLKIEGDRANVSGSGVLDRRDFGIGVGYDDESTVGFDVGVALELVALRGGQAVPAKPAPETGSWSVETGDLGIEVVQFGSVVSGQFAEWDATISYDDAAEGPIKGRVEAEIDIASLTLGSVTDNALAPEFFDAANFPKATYVGDIVAAGEGLIVDGVLALKGAEAAVPLAFELVIDGDRAEAEGLATLDRRDFGIGVGYDDESTVGFAVDVVLRLTAVR